MEITNDRRKTSSVMVKEVFEKRKQNIIRTTVYKLKLYMKRLRYYKIQLSSASLKEIVRVDAKKDQKVLQ